ncbi:MAG: hypothetical protein U1F76_24140 [Candidatus Competibacteraceae bacterium]
MTLVGIYAGGAVFLAALGASTVAAYAADPGRENEARALDLKMQQQQRLWQQPEGSDRRQLEDRFDRQRAQQRELQLRQRRQLPPADSGPPDSSQGSQQLRFKQQQQGQRLDFKMQTPPLKPTEPAPLEFPGHARDSFNDR